MAQSVMPYRPKPAQGIMLSPGLPALTADGLNVALTLGKVLAESGFFPTVRNAAQAVVKIIKGQALGWDPIFSMENIYVMDIGGKQVISMSALGMAARINTSKQYAYKLGRWDESQCNILFYSVDANGTARILHESRYTMDDAKRAALDVKDTYKKFPKSMLFSGAMRHGFKAVCPELGCGCVSNGGREADFIEADAVVDGETTEDVSAAQVAEVSEREPEHVFTEPERRAMAQEIGLEEPQELAPDADDAREAGVEPDQYATTAQTVKKSILMDIRTARQEKPATADKPITENQRGMLFATLKVAGIVTDADRHALLLCLLGHTSTTTMTQGEVVALVHWLQAPNAAREAQAAIRAGHAMAGQTEMQAVA